MSAIANIVAYGAEATPLPHTFKPISVSRMGEEVLAEYREDITDVPPALQPYVKLRSRKLPSGVEQTRITVAIPVQEVITNQNAAGYTAAPKVAHTLSGEVTFHFSPRAIISQRRQLRQIMYNMLGGYVITATVQSTGNVPEIVDQAINPT